jgi:glycerol-3-phosphate dehydrogenase
MRESQVAIIGGGVIGSAVARELSKYNVKVVVFEAGSDVASGASKGNSGVIHSGINSPPSSLKARFCVEGNKMFQFLANELGFPLKWVGKFVIAKNESEVKEIEQLREVGIANGVPNLKIIEGKEVKKKEPNITCYAALWVPTAGITSPYEFTIALAENAAENGVKFLLETKVIGLKKRKGYFLIETKKGKFKSEILVNAAGINCRDIASMLEEPDFNIYPCRGEYLVLDKEYAYLIKSMVYPVPVKEMGVLGVHITPTIEGNILIGPSAEFIEDKDDTSTTREMMETLLKEAKEIIPILPEKAVINAYSGIRCKLAPPEAGGWADYRIEESKNTPGLINLLGIESPGLTAAPAIAKEVKNMIGRIINLKKKDNFKPKRNKSKRFSEMSTKEKSEIIKKDSRWGRIVCRCEHVTEAEVINALSNPLGARTLASVKYRCRAGMGRCQGGFCTQHIIRIMENYFGMDIKDIKLKSPSSNLFYSRTREVKK